MDRETAEIQERVESRFREMRATVARITREVEEDTRRFERLSEMLRSASRVIDEQAATIERLKSQLHEAETKARHDDFVKFMDGLIRE